VCINCILYLYGISFIFIGEYLQSKYGSKRKYVIFEIILDMLILIPVIFILSGLFLIILINRDNRKYFGSIIVKVKYQLLFFIASVTYDELFIKLKIVKMIKTNTRIINKSKNLKSCRGFMLFGLTMFIISFNGLLILGFNYYNIIQLYMILTILLIVLLYNLFLEQILVYINYINHTRKNLVTASNTR
jgi:hypothetical protein